MGIIRQLPKEVIERIAAGEVVERPASVVKELVENSIDAGAASIAVDVADGGKSRIAVIDDGRGMDASDLRLCVSRHATSKISIEEDLWNISSMGFRGEALAAVGAVSKLEIESRINRSDVIEGARIEVEGGQVAGPMVAGCAGGTKVVVSALFFNVPARQKFLRSAAVEFGHISDVVTSMALAFPGIRFELAGDGKRRFVAVSNDVSERTLSVLGDRFREGLVAVEEPGDFIRISGWVAEGGRSGGKDLHIFVNRRPVRDRLLLHAINAAFGERLARGPAPYGAGRGESPAAVLWIEIDPAKVDVNVHPTKREVRFANAGAVHDFVEAAVRKALSVHSAPAATFAGVEDAMRRYEERRLFTRDEGTEGRGMRDVRTSGRQDVTFSSSDVTSLRPDVPTPLVSKGNLRALGQLGSTYVVCEDAGGTLVLIDQHAAHERLGFDALNRQYAAGSIAQQRLLVPERVELGDKGLAYVEEHIDALSRAGFEVEPFGGGTLMVKAVPEILGDASTGPIFEKLASDLEELGSSRSVDDEVIRIFAAVACHRQVRTGDRLSIEELSALVRDVERANVTHCPHGRPAIVRVERVEIEKWFKRRS